VRWWELAAKLVWLPSQRPLRGSGRNVSNWNMTVTWWLQVFWMKTSCLCACVRVECLYVACCLLHLGFISTTECVCPYSSSRARLELIWVLLKLPIATSSTGSRVIKCTLIRSQGWIRGSSSHPPPIATNYTASPD